MDSDALKTAVILAKILDPPRRTPGTFAFPYESSFRLTATEHSAIKPEYQRVS